MGCPQSAHESRFAFRYEISLRSHSPISGLLEPVDGPGGLGADEALLDVTADERPVALLGGPVAAASRHQDLHLVAVAERHAGELRRRHRPEALDERPPLRLAGALDPEAAHGADAPSE